MSEVTKRLDQIQRIVHAVLKPHGFTKHGRTLHRFVSGDISQVIFFQTGQAYRQETHLFTVNIGIRVPECMASISAATNSAKKYYHEYECNIRSSLGTVKGRDVTVYNVMYMPENWITEDIIRQLQEYVLPAFDTLNSREAILQHRREYPRFDVLHRNILSREEALIYLSLGQRADAERAFNQQLLDTWHRVQQKNIPALTYRNWFKNDLDLLQKLGLSLWESTTAEIGLSE